MLYVPPFYGSIMLFSILNLLTWSPTMILVLYFTGMIITQAYNRLNLVCRGVRVYRHTYRCREHEEWELNRVCCTSNGSLRELLNSFSQLCTVVSAERSSFYKYHLCWYLSCCILRSCLSSHSRCVLISSIPDILEIWGADKEKRCGVWKRFICVFLPKRAGKGEATSEWVSFCARLDGWYAGGSSLYIILFSPCNNSLRLAL